MCHPMCESTDTTGYICTRMRGCKYLTAGQVVPVEMVLKEGREAHEGQTELLQSKLY